MTAQNGHTNVSTLAAGEGRLKDALSRCHQQYKTKITFHLLLGPDRKKSGAKAVL